MAYMPGLAAPVAIDTATLAPELASALEELVRQADFFSAPATVGTVSRGAADHQTYRITIHDHHRSHTIKVVDLAARPEVAALVQGLQRHVKELRRGKPDAK
jgi:hypothetical protein